MLAHVDMDAFYASVEVLDRPQLAAKPVIVGGLGPRGVVSAASYQARAFGVRSAMPIFQAKRLCPQGVFLQVRMARYRQVSALVMSVLDGFSPLVEQVSVDEAYLDLSGAQGLWGGPFEAGAAIKAEVLKQTGLTCSVGMAPLRFLAKIASDRDKPDGLVVVGDLEAFLQTVKLGEVPGVGKKALAKLRAMGLNRLVELRPLGPKRLEAVMGSFGLRLWDLCRGRDPGGVVPSRPVKSVSHEVTLGEDTSDKGLLRSILLGLSQKTARRLRAKGKSGKVVTLKLKHSDMTIATRRCSLERPTQQTQEIYLAGRNLLDSYSRPGPFRLIGVGVSGLGPADQAQGGLFGRKALMQRQALARAEDAICRKFGEKAISRAGALKPPGPGGKSGT